MNFSIKDFLKLDKLHGKKLVLVMYYALTAGIVIHMIVSFIYGIALLFTPEQVWLGLGNVLFALPLAVLYFIILRVICELITSLFDMTGKSEDPADFNL